MASILILDEATPERELLVAALTRAGHRLTFAADGAEGLRRWQAERHELVLADEATFGAPLAARIKAETKEGYQPVLLICERANLAARVAALAVADDAVNRPYEPSEVVARIEALLRTRRLVDQLRVARAESDARTFTDAQTGLRSRVFLGERLNEEWKRAVRYNEPLSLLLVALEGAKTLVEARGAPFGERLLQVLAAAALKSLRQIDIVTRYGAYEIAALLPNTHFAGSLTCAERLREEVARCPVDDYRPLVSIGIAFYPGKEIADPTDLVRLAARALERAQEEGPGNICLFQHQGYLFQPR